MKTREGASRAPLKIPRQRDFGHLKQSPLDCVIPAWSAGIQVDMDVPEASLRTWLPAIHAGMTKFAF